MAKNKKGLGYNLSDYSEYETSTFNYDDRISDYMNSKVGNNRKYRLQRISELNQSIAMERNYLPENFSVGDFSTGAVNQNAHVPLGVATSGWQKGMPNPNLVASPVEGVLDEKPNWTFYKNKNFKDKWNQEAGKFSKTVGSAFQKLQSLPNVQKASLATLALTGVAAAFLSSRAEESDYKINKKVNTFG